MAILVCVTTILWVPFLMPFAGFELLLDGVILSYCCWRVSETGNSRDKAGTMDTFITSIGILLFMLLTFTLGILHALHFPLILTWLGVTVLLINSPSLTWLWNVLAGLVIFPILILLIGDTVGPGKKGYYRRFWFGYFVIHPLLIVIAALSVNIIRAPWAPVMALITVVLDIITVLVSTFYNSKRE